MLNNKGNRARESPCKSDFNSNQKKQPIGDPWLTASKAKPIKPLPKTWQLHQEPNLLTSTEGGKEIPILLSHQSSSVEILLQDELKLKNIFSSLLEQKLEKALALLYWDKTKLIV